MSYRGELGPLGRSNNWSVEVYYIVDANAPHCKVIPDQFLTIRAAEIRISENPRWKDIKIVTESEFINAWNKRFWNGI